MKKVLPLIVPVLLLVIAGCSSGANTESDPRQAVIKMFRAIERNERETLAHFLDFETLLKAGLKDYALKMTTCALLLIPRKYWMIFSTGV